MTFFLANIVESQLMFSGAFEIFYNGLYCMKYISSFCKYNFPKLDVPIWSKLSTGRIPSYSELFDMVDSQHKFYQNELFGDSMHAMPGQKL